MMINESYQYVSSGRATRAAIAAQIEYLRREAQASEDDFLAYLLGMAESRAKEPAPNERSPDTDGAPRATKFFLERPVKDALVIQSEVDGRVSRVSVPRTEMAALLGDLIDFVSSLYEPDQVGTVAEVQFLSFLITDTASVFVRTRGLGLIEFRTKELPNVSIGPEIDLSSLGGGD